MSWQYPSRWIDVCNIQPGDSIIHDGDSKTVVRVGNYPNTIGSDSNNSDRISIEFSDGTGTVRHGYVQFERGSST